MTPRSSYRKENAASGKQVVLFTTVIATSCLVVWFVISAAFGYSSRGWLTMYFNWIALRGIKEWLLAWLCLWAVSCLAKSNWAATVTICLCAFSLVLLEQGSLYVNALSAGLFSFDFLMFFTPLILLELSNLYWMYAGVLLSIAISRQFLIATNSPGYHSVPPALLPIKKMARRAILKGLLFTTIFSMIIIMVWVVASGGRLPNIAGLIVFFQSVVVTPLFRLICGLSVAGLFFLIPPIRRRPKVGGMILGAVSIVVVLYSTFMATWGSHFSLLGSFFPNFYSASVLLAFPVIVALSPVGGFALSIPLLWLHGYRFAQLPSSGWSSNQAQPVDASLDDSEDINDPEMYL